MKRVGYYARVSTPSQDTSMQLEEAREVAARRGWTFGEYVDVIGKGQEGPERRRLLADVRAGRIDAVVCWKLDRLGRSARDVLLFLDELATSGVVLISLREGFDSSTAIGRAIIGILAVLAELERATIRERVKAGVDKARRSGKRLGRRRRVVDVQRALRMLAEGRSERSIAMALKVPRATLRDAVARARAVQCEGSAPTPGSG